MNIDAFTEHFSAIDDSRQSAKVTYPLFDVLFGTLCSVIAGARGWFDIREYVQGQHDWFLSHGLFKEGVPADDTIARIISTIKPEQFRECFLNWMTSVHQLTQGEVVAIDGKTLRGSYNREDRNSTIHNCVESPGPVNRAFVRLEPCAVKVACRVLRGENDGNVVLLPDSACGKMPARSTKTTPQKIWRVYGTWHSTCLGLRQPSSAMPVNRSGAG